jgi:hypothetical protein
LDFSSAFDSISQQYLYIVHNQYEFGNNMVNNTKTVKENAQSKVQIGGFLSHPFPIERSVRQGCPSSMIYTLPMNPSRMMEERK